MESNQQQNLFSGKNIFIAIIILLAGIAIGATVAPSLSKLPTFLGGIPEAVDVPAGTRHIALKVNDVIGSAGQTKSTSIYMENVAPSDSPEVLCSFFVTMNYDANKMTIGNLLKSETLAAEYTSFSAQDDAKNATIKVSGTSKDCNAKMTSEVMELATFDVTIKEGVAPGFVAFEINDSGQKGSSQIVAANKTDVMTLSSAELSGLFVSDGQSQSISAVTPATLSGKDGGTLTVQGKNVYSLYYIQGAEDNINGSKAYYFEDVVPGYDSVPGLLAGNMEPGRYYVCAHSLFGLAGENICSTTPILTIE